jgi:hypothetical protein
MVSELMGGLSLELPVQAPAAANVEGGGFAGTDDSGVSMVDDINATCYSIFEQRFAAIRQVLPFKPNYVSEQGQLDAMVECEDLKSWLGNGDQGKCADIYGRKVIVIGTPLGLVVVHEAETDSNRLMFVAPVAMKRAGIIRSKGRQLDPSEIEIVLGSTDGKRLNVGKAVAAMTAALPKKD